MSTDLTLELQERVRAALADSTPLRLLGNDTKAFIGRAGGGEEMGGARGVLHYMQRTAVQGSPAMIAEITREWTKVLTGK